MERSEASSRFRAGLPAGNAQATLSTSCSSCAGSLSGAKDFLKSHRRRRVQDSCVSLARHSEFSLGAALRVGARKRSVWQALGNSRSGLQPQAWMSTKRAEAKYAAGARTFRACRNVARASMRRVCGKR